MAARGSFKEFVNFAAWLRVDELEGLHLLEVRAVVEDFCLVVPGVGREWYSRVCGLWKELCTCVVEADSWRVYCQLWTEYGAYLRRMLSHCRSFSARSAKSPIDRAEERWDLDALGYRLCVACCSSVWYGGSVHMLGESFQDHYLRLDCMRETLDVYRLLDWYGSIVDGCVAERQRGEFGVDRLEAVGVSRFRETCYIAECLPDICVFG